jgi:hypothetical protein
VNVGIAYSPQAGVRALASRPDSGSVLSGCFYEPLNIGPSPSRPPLALRFLTSMAANKESNVDPQSDSPVPSNAVLPLARRIDVEYFLRAKSASVGGFIDQHESAE